MSEKARREEAERLDAEILDAIGRSWSDPLDEAEFDGLSRAIFAHQFRFNPVYRQFCHLRGVSASADVASWREIPPVPTGAFKVGRWATFPAEAESAAFRTSGTTQGQPGIHRFETLGLTNAAIASSARRFLFPDREGMRCFFLSPPPAEVADSSLVHMFAVFREAFGAPGSAFLFSRRVAAAGAFRPEVLAAALDAASGGGEPVLVAGAVLAFNHALSLLPGAWELPAGSRTMVTGGFKGFVGVADPARLADDIERRLGVPRSHQVEEYGMTELSTQYYGANLRQAVNATGGAAGREVGFHVPPWARVRVVDSTTGVDMDPGAVGALIHYDLANRASAFAVQTSDVGRSVSQGAFELRGREPGTEARGCSLAAELWLERT